VLLLLLLLPLLLQEHLFGDISISKSTCFCWFPRYSNIQGLRFVLLLLLLHEHLFGDNSDRMNAGANHKEGRMSTYYSIQRDI
jgi:hypothetical protein